MSLHKLSIYDQSLLMCLVMARYIVSYPYGCIVPSLYVLMSYMKFGPYSNNT